MVSASRGLSEATVGVSSGRRGLPSFGAEDAVSVDEAMCSPSLFSADRITGVRLGRHDALRITGGPDLIHIAGC